MMHIPRPLCKHGVKPQVETERVLVDGSPGFERYTQGRTSLVYDCPTPWECAAEAYRTTPHPSDQP